MFKTRLKKAAGKKKCFKKKVLFIYPVAPMLPSAADSDRKAPIPQYLPDISRLQTSGRSQVVHRYI
jgi:hypothetical protein